MSSVDRTGRSAPGSGGVVSEQGSQAEDASRGGPARKSRQVERTADVREGADSDKARTRAKRAAGSAPSEKTTPSNRAPLYFDPTELPTDPVRAAREGAEIGNWHKHGAIVVTAKSVEELVHGGDLSSITPAIPEHLWPTVRAVLECYSVDGPLGDHGPLSARGAIGRSPWNVSFWTGDAKPSGGGGEGGPLSELGPDSDFAKKEILPRINQLSKHLQAGGIFAGVGPESALGAKGPLGFLGVLGGHGFAQNKNGDFIGDGGVVRTTDVRYEGRARTLELVELYREDHAKGLKNNDTSWMVRGVIENREADTFSFSSRQDQFVTLTVVPENLSDVFEIELLDRKGNVVARSDSDRYINWIQVQVDEARELKARVKLKESRAVNLAEHPVSMFIDTMLAPLITWGEMSTPFLKAAGHEVDRAFERGAYRLCVVGSTEKDLETDIRGDHQQRIFWPAND